MFRLLLLSVLVAFPCVLRADYTGSSITFLNNASWPASLRCVLSDGSVYEVEGQIPIQNTQTGTHDPYTVSFTRAFVPSGDPYEAANFLTFKWQVKVGPVGTWTDLTAPQRLFWFADDGQPNDFGSYGHWTDYNGVGGVFAVGDVNSQSDIGTSQGVQVQDLNNAVYDIKWPLYCLMGVILAHIAAQSIRPDKA